MSEHQAWSAKHGSVLMAGGSPQGPNVAIPNVVVVDPRFDAYRDLAASAREGRLLLHFRGGGGDALRLGHRVKVDVWLVAADLDDMSGSDFVQLLCRQSRARESKIVMVEPSHPGGRRWSMATDEAAASGATAVLPEPITFASLERLLGLPGAERRRHLAEAAADVSRAFVSLPVSLGAAAVAMVLLFAG